MRCCGNVSTSPGQCARSAEGTSGQPVRQAMSDGQMTGTDPATPAPPAAQQAAVVVAWDCWTTCKRLRALEHITQAQPDCMAFLTAGSD